MPINSDEKINNHENDLGLPPAPAEWIPDVPAAAYMGVATQTARNWRCRGIGPPYAKIGRLVRYYLPDLAAWMKSHMIKTEK